jgi:hypothetical protein
VFKHGGQIVIDIEECVCDTGKHLEKPVFYKCDVIWKPVLCGDSLFTVGRLFLCKNV